ncbi:hypothetical protein [Oceanicaulis sp. MMSF_3324]|uniref:hypothetical protein n=1 Tax=Oceanicaulis sp. MMSF_3324 TaxID=3046702 RepID=UPI00273DED98|nr:hypothetical protein [Oceanicaulis sp. MMSF_3324]
MTSSDVYLDPAWRLDRFDQTGTEAIFIRADRDRLSEAPFLDQRWRQPHDELAALSVQNMVSHAPKSAPPAFIWHSAFCCSTLLAGVLDHEGAALGVREPDMLMTLANLKRQGQGVSGVLPAVLNWLSRGYDAGERAVIKPTNLANNLMSDAMAASPSSKAILLTSSLRAFLVSIVKKGEAGRAFARFMYTVFAMDGRALSISEIDRLRLTDLQIAALVWHMQIAEMNALSQGEGSGRVAWLDGDAFIARPEPVLARVAEFLELDLTAAQIAQAASGPKMSRNAKAPEQGFAAASRAEQNEQIARSLGPDLDRIIEWSYGLHADTPSDAPVAPALLG